MPVELILKLFLGFLTTVISGGIIMMKRDVKKIKENIQEINAGIDKMMTTLKQPVLLQKELEEIWKYKESYIKPYKPIYDFLLFKTQNFIKFMRKIYEMPLFDPSELDLETTELTQMLKDIQKKANQISLNFGKKYKETHMPKTEEFISKINEIASCKNNHRRERIHDEAKLFLNEFIDNLFTLYMEVQDAKKKN